MKILKEFEYYSKEVHHHPTVHNVHELRKITRRLRTILNNQKIDKLAEILGQQRDLDVSIVNAHRFNLEDSDLKIKRKEHREFTQDFLSLKKIKKLKSAIKHEEIFPHGVSSRLKGLRRELKEWEKKRIAPKNLHELRIFVKKFRYTYEALGTTVPGLKKLQDDLGKIHDLDVLEELLGWDNAVLAKKKTMTTKTIQDAEQKLSRLAHFIEARSPAIILKAI